MKKGTAAWLVVFMLFSVVIPAGATGYIDTATDYLMERHNVPAEQIQIHEGGMMDLEKLGESFWFAKYTILPEGVGLNPREGPEKFLPIRQFPTACF